MNDRLKNLRKNWSQICHFDLVTGRVFWEEKFGALPSKNNVADEKKLLQSGKFSSATLFLEGSALNFSSPIFFQMRAGQNNKYDITKDFRFFAGLASTIGHW